MPDALSPKLQKRLPLALAVLRLTLAAFLLLWAVEKVLRPEANAEIWAQFYKIEISPDLSPWIGWADVVFVLAFAGGLWRSVTYGLGLLFHGVSVLSTWSYLIQPFGAPNHLFTAGVPVLAGFVVLFMLRDWDQWTLDGLRERKTKGAVVERP